MFSKHVNLKLKLVFIWEALLMLVFPTYPALEHEIKLGIFS
jgi:hypothetical protein